MSRNIFSCSAVIASLLATALFAGCGTSNKEGNLSAADVAKVEETACAQCHSTAIDHIAGTPIYDAYLQSAHFTNNFRVVGCQDCHGGGAQHNGVGPLPYPNPDAAGKCFECHEKYLPTNHFASYTAAAHPGQYVSTNYKNSCTSCHDPHLAQNGILNGEINTVTGLPKGTEHTDWAESGHGEVDGEAWAHYDFKLRDNCNRCHTSTGYITYVSSNYAYPVPAWGTAGDKTNEVLTCKACHTDYNFKNRIRRAGAFSAPFNGNKNPIAFPDSGTSNLCIACHSGYESGGAIGGFTGTLTALTGDMDTKSAVNSHYLAAAALFYGKSAFHFYTSNVKYDTGYNTGKNFGTWSHGRLGMIDPATNQPYVASGVSTGEDGPCVACHLGSVNGNTKTHTLSASETWNAQGRCFGCHSNFAAEGGVDAVIEEEKELFDRGLDFYLFTLANHNIGNKTPIYYDVTTYPYFHKSLPAKRGTTDFKTWTMGTADSTIGKQVMGVAFNYNLINREKGAHVHNRAYTRRLMFDGIQYLQKGANTYSTSTGSIGGTADPNAQLSFTGYSTAVAAGTRPANPVSISTLKGWLLRSSGGLYYRR